MPDFSQSASGLEPRVVIDHVLLPSSDLAQDAARLEEKFGLHANEGGRHPRVGTANYIVPLGKQYLELIAVVDRDEAASSRLGVRVANALRDRRMFVAWALRTDDLDALRATLLSAGWELPPTVEGSRRRPDGQVLSWRTQDVDEGPAVSPIPFVIEWHVPEGLHPGEGTSAHRVGPAASLRKVVVGARDPDSVRDKLELLLGRSPMYEVEEAEDDGVREITLGTDSGDLVVS